MATVGISVISIGGAMGLLTSPFMIHTLELMGYPAYFRVELAIGKIIGGVLLLAPAPASVKETASWVMGEEEMACTSLSFMSCSLYFPGATQPVR